MGNRKRVERKERGKSFPSFLSPRLFFLSTTVLMIICMACSNSPVEEDNQDKEAPDLEKILVTVTIRCFSERGLEVDATI